MEILVPSTSNPELTLDSPIEHLPLSRRARNSLQKAGCATIRSLVESDSAAAIQKLGVITREEIVSLLREHGFGTPAPLAEVWKERVSEMEVELSRLRTQIDATSRQWQARVERLENRLKRLNAAEDAS